MKAPTPRNRRPPPATEQDLEAKSKASRRRRHRPRRRLTGPPREGREPRTGLPWEDFSQNFKYLLLFLKNH